MIDWAQISLSMFENVNENVLMDRRRKRVLLFVGKLSTRKVEPRTTRWRGREKCFISDKQLVSKTFRARSNKGHDGIDKALLLLPLLVIQVNARWDTCRLFLTIPLHSSLLVFLRPQISWMSGFENWIIIIVVVALLVAPATDCNICSKETVKQSDQQVADWPFQSLSIGKSCTQFKARQVQFSPVASSSILSTSSLGATANEICLEHQPSFIQPANSWALLSSWKPAWSHTLQAWTGRHFSAGRLKWRPVQACRLAAVPSSN